MSTYLSIHTKEETQTFGAGPIKYVMEDNANALQLSFGDTTITVYTLSYTDAHLLLAIAKMDAAQRASVLAYSRVLAGAPKPETDDTFVFDGMQS